MTKKYPPTPPGVSEKMWRQAVDGGYSDRYLPKKVRKMTETEYKKWKRQMYGDD